MDRQGTQNNQTVCERFIKDPIIIDEYTGGEIHRYYSLSGLERNIKVFFNPICGYREEPNIEKYLFEPCDEKCFNEIRDDLKHFLNKKFRWINEISINRVYFGDDTSQPIVYINTHPKEEPLTSPINMFDYIVKKIEMKPDWGSSGYRSLDETYGGEGIEVFNHHQLIDDLYKLWELFENAHRS
jgi:hypothetical protein